MSIYCTRIVASPVFSPQILNVFILRLSSRTNFPANFTHDNFGWSFSFLPFGPCKVFIRIFLTHNRRMLSFVLLFSEENFSLFLTFLLMVFAIRFVSWSSQITRMKYIKLASNFSSLYFPESIFTSVKQVL